MMDEYLDVLLPRQTRPASLPASTSSEYQIVSTYTSVNAWGLMGTFTVTVPPAALTTYTVANTLGLGVVVTSEIPQESLTTYTSKNAFNIGIAVTTRRDPTAISSTATSDASATSSVSSPTTSTPPPGASPAASGASQSTGTTGPQSSSSHHGLGGGAIAAAVVVPVVVVALLILAAFFFLRRRRRQRSAARIVSFNGTGAAVVGGAGPHPQMMQLGSSRGLTALPRLDNGAETPASTKTGNPFNEPSVSSASGNFESSIRSASGGRHVVGGAAGRRPQAETIAELPADAPGARDADDDAASIDSDFSFHHAEVADASQARKQRASVVQLSGSPPKEHGSPKDTGSPK